MWKQDHFFFEIAISPNFSVVTLNCFTEYMVQFKFSAQLLPHHSILLSSNLIISVLTYLLTYSLHGAESSYVYLLYCVHIAVFFTLDAGLLARSQYSEVPATGHLETGFSWFPCVYKKMLRWFPTFQVATTCFSCSLPDLNLVVTYFKFCLHVK